MDRLLVKIIATLGAVPRDFSCSRGLMEGHLRHRR